MIFLNYNAIFKYLFAIKLKFICALLILIWSLSAIAEDKYPALLVYGDSISAGYGMSKEKQWSEVLKSLFDKENININIFNTSVSGETTSGGLARIDRILDELQPSYILIELGGNDALRGYPPKKIFSNLKKMIEAAKKRNIIVTNTPDVLTDATAEIAILILLGAARRVKEGIEWANKKNWKWSADFLMGKQLTGSRLGILGMGRIGRAVADRARSFGMIVHYHNRSQLDKNSEKGAVYHSTLESLLKKI